MAIEEERGKVLPSSWAAMTARSCDSCKSSAPLLFCRVDSAFLCLGCDSRIHAANKLASRHERVWMCAVCEQAPAAVTCKADAAALCFTCDSDIHSANPLARRHERLPVIPFLDCPPPAVQSEFHLFNGHDDVSNAEEAEAASWLLSDPNPKLASEAPNPKSTDPAYYFSDVDPYLDLDYATATAAADSVVPVQTKPSAIQHQLFAPSALENGGVEFDFGHSKLPSSFSYLAPSLSQSVSSSSMDVGIVPDGSCSGTTTTDTSNPSDMNTARLESHQQQQHYLPGMDREARVLRYREKRKNRKFEKTIRYASRKAYAETRPRIKGRFAKRLDGDSDRLYSPAAATALIADAGYGVVPSF